MCPYNPSILQPSQDGAQDEPLIRSGEAQAGLVPPRQPPDALPAPALPASAPENGESEVGAFQLLQVQQAARGRAGSAARAE